MKMSFDFRGRSLANKRRREYVSHDWENMDEEYWEEYEQEEEGAYEETTEYEEGYEEEYYGHYIHHPTHNLGLLLLLG